MVRRIRMKGDEFIQRAISGDRPFTRIILPEGFNICGHEEFERLQYALKHSDSQRSPLNFNESKLVGVNFGSIYAPFIRAKSAMLRGSNFEGAVLSYGRFNNADMRRAYLGGANLSHSVLEGVDLSDTNLVETSLREANLRDTRLNYADVSGADVSGSDLTDARLHNVANLKEIVNFKYAQNTGKLKVTPHEQRAIKNATKESPNPGDNGLASLDEMLDRNYRVIVDRDCEKKAVEWLRKHETIMGHPVLFGKRLTKILKRLKKKNPKVLKDDLDRYYQYLNEILGMAREENIPILLGRRGISYG